MNHQTPTRLLLVALTSTALLAVAACGTTPGDTTAAAPSPAAAEANANGESVPVPYTDSRYHYRIDAPGPMTANTDGTASYTGPSERLRINVLTGDNASNPSATAASDLTALSTSAPGFKKLTDPEKVTINGRNVIRFAYTWNAGTSVVTGKVIDLTTTRYYVPKDSGTVAVLTYGIVSNRFDPQGADDLESTFAWQ